MAWLTGRSPPGPGELALVRWLRLWPEHPVRTLLALVLALGAARPREAARRDGDGRREGAPGSPPAGAEAPRVVKGSPSP